jgi:hypothetical protein
MSATVEEVLRLVAGYEETVVALTARGPMRLDYWACGMWSANKTLGETAVGLWLRHTLSRYLDEKTASAVASTYVYRAVKEVAGDAGVEMRYEELNFKPVELRLRGVYNGRAVYRLKPFRCNVKALAVRLYVPTWSLCPTEEGEDCKRRAELTEKLREMGINIEDATRGIYVPVDVSELESFLRRVM